MISARNLGYSGILVHASLRAGRGGITCIIGPNGAGKSTFLKLLAGLLVPDSGEVLVGENTLESLSIRERSRLIAYVPQRLEALPDITVYEFVVQSSFSFGADELSGGDSVDLLARRALSLLGLSDLAGRRLPSLSGGELQRAVISAAIMQRTPVILLDEPAASLDIAQSLHIESVLRQLCDEGRTVVMVTHDLQSAWRLADSTVLLVDGKVVYGGEGFPSTELLSRVYGLEERYFCAMLEGNQDALREGGEGLCAEAGCGDDGKDDASSEVSSDDRSVRKTVLIAGLALILLSAILPFAGSEWIRPDVFFSGESVDRTILLWMRIPRVLWAFVSGAALSCVGAALQAMLQNPLATPYTLGIASGANLGAVTAILLGVSSVCAVPGFAFVGAVMTMGAVLVITMRARTPSPLHLILAGVAASLFCSAAGMIVQALATPVTAQQMMRWQMGGFDVFGYESCVLFVPVSLCVAALFVLAPSLNLISVDASLARTRGVHVSKVYVLTFLCAGMATACIVSVCGPVGFVGLLIPLWLRQRYGADLRRILPLCAIFGAIFILAADLVARLMENAVPIPAGVIVAVIGVPAVVASFMHANGHAGTKQRRAAQVKGPK